MARLGSHRRFTGTGHSPDGAVEMMTVNRQIADIAHAIVIPLVVTEQIEAVPQSH